MAEKRLYIRATSVPNLAAAVAAFRERTGFTMGELASSLKSGRPIPITGEWIACAADHRLEALAFLDRLDGLGLAYETLLGDETVSPTFLRNQLGLRRTIEHESRMISDLESDDPSEEALEWHRRHLNAEGR